MRETPLTAQTHDSEQGRRDAGSGGGGSGEQGRGGDRGVARLCPVRRAEEGLGESRQSDGQSEAQSDQPPLHLRPVKGREINYSLRNLERK